MQPDRRIATRRQHHPRGARQNRQQSPELAESLGRPQLVEIVDDQHDRFERLGQLGADHVEQVRAVNSSRCRGLRLRSDRRCRAAERIEYRKPEPFRVLLLAVDGHEP